MSNAQSVTMASSVETTLTALDLEPEHTAAAALARLYAGQLDSAGSSERAADRALAIALALGADAETAELIQSLRSKLAARTTVANIGPRLESLLGKLLATPKDAGSAATAPPETPRAATPGALSVLRGGKSG